MSHLIFPLSTIQKYNTKNRVFFEKILSEIRQKNYDVAEDGLKKKLLSGEMLANPDVYYLLAYIAYVRKDYVVSQQYLANMLKASPQALFALVSLGHLHVLQKQTEKAISIYYHAHKLFPREPRVLIYLGELLSSIGQYGEAYKAYSACLTLLPAEQQENIVHKSVLCLSRLQFMQYSKEIEQQILNVYKVRNVDYDALLKPSFSLLVHKYGLSEDMLSVDLEHLAKDELFLNMLSSSINIDILFELWLIKIRKALLLKFSSGNNSNDLDDLRVAFAIQNFMNEYVHSVDQEEISHLAKLKISHEGEEVAYFTYAMYVKPEEFLISQQEQALSPLRQKFYRLIYKNTAEELALRGEIVHYGIEHEVDTKVRTQYEENPYPRWFSLPLAQPMEFAAYIANKLPWFKWGILPQNKGLNVLIAGCGTGKQVITFAQHFPQAQIIAIDISVTSLAYAKRQAKAYCLSNIEFRHMSILDVAMFESKFDIIKCCGVLHHLESPVQGLELLNAQLKDNGLLKIALYSKVARAGVSKVRHYFDKKNVVITSQNVVNERAKLQKSDLWRDVADIAKFRDFYSTSGTRDLIFHEREQQMDVHWIKNTLATNNIKFLGFEFNAPESLVQFKKLYPEKNSQLGLANWALFEQEYPDTFANMYTFWGAKVKS